MVLGCRNIGTEFPKRSLGDSYVHLELRLPGLGLYGGIQRGQDMMGLLYLLVELNLDHYKILKFKNKIKLKKIKNEIFLKKKKKL